MNNFSLIIIEDKKISVSHVRSGFASRPGHTKDHHKNGTNCLPAWHAGIRVGVWQCSRVVCGMVYTDMHCKYLL